MTLSEFFKDIVIKDNFITFETDLFIEAIITTENKYYLMDVTPEPNFFRVGFNALYCSWEVKNETNKEYHFLRLSRDKGDMDIKRVYNMMIDIIKRTTNERNNQR